MVADIVSSVLFVAGTAFAVTAVVGLWRLPDVYARMHAAAKPATLSAALVLGGASLQAGSYETAAKLLVALALQLLIGPLAAHVLSGAAHTARAELSPFTVVDEFREHGETDAPPPG